MSRLRGERGWALLTTVLVMGILMALALPLLSMVDVQQRNTAQERRSEGSFALADAALSSMVFILSNDWPASSGVAYLPCTAASTGGRCPDAELLAATYDGVDFTDRAWKVSVHDDDKGSEFYDEGDLATEPGWDANGNNKVWLRADGRAAGLYRSVVSLVKMQEQVENMPRYVVTSGWLDVTTGGNKVIVDTLGDAGESAPLSVRCSGEAPAAGCLDYDPAKHQVSPDTSQDGHVGNALSPAALERLRVRADSLDSYYETGCPASPAGELVFVESANCTYSGNGSVNSADEPGIFVVATGTVTFKGSFDYHGLVYGANLQGSAGAVVTIGGNSHVFGSIAVDGKGGIEAGASGTNLTYSERIWDDVVSWGTASLVQGTWRELPASPAGDPAPGVDG